MEVFKSTRDWQTRVRPGHDLHAYSVVCDMEGFAKLASDLPSNNESRARCTVSSEWMGRKAYQVAVDELATGDESLVKLSDEALTKFEGLAPMPTPNFRVEDAVAGGVPNVPAAIAGHPMAMRRRVRARSDFAPVSIVCELTVSAGVDTKQLRTRAALILALVRFVSAVRPVNCYVCIRVGNRSCSANVYVRLDTSPIDLARACHVFMSPAVLRGLGYGICRELMQENGHIWGGGWAYGSGADHKLGAIDAAATLGIDESNMLYIPGGHMTQMANPEKWLKDRLDELGLGAEGGAQ